MTRTSAGRVCGRDSAWTPTRAPASTSAPPPSTRVRPPPVTRGLRGEPRHDYRPAAALRQPGRPADEPGTGAAFTGSLQCNITFVRIIPRMELAQRLIVALDVNSRESALKLVPALRP